MHAIVPAYNEQRTVARVVGTLLSADCFETVTVVDDGSSDLTSKRAQEAGANVLRTPQNMGKGRAMQYAYKQLKHADDRVAFFDADLLRLRQKHVRRLVQASNKGYDMVAGLREKGPLGNVLQIAYIPLITGERICKRWVLELIPDVFWSGYGIETAINWVVQKHGGKTALILMDGVSFRTKGQKTSMLEGAKGHIKMGQQILRTRRALRQRNTGS